VVGATATDDVDGVHEATVFAVVSLRIRLWPANNDGIAVRLAVLDDAIDGVTFSCCAVEVAVARMLVVLTVARTPLINGALGCVTATGANGVMDDEADVRWATTEGGGLRKPVGACNRLTAPLCNGVAAIVVVVDVDATLIADVVGFGFNPNNARE
jgi:hypothetical protein